MLTRAFSGAVGFWRSFSRPVLKAEADPTPSPLGNLGADAECWQLDEGFYQPVWPKITERIAACASSEAEKKAAWHGASLQWLQRLQKDLGEGFGVEESRNFLLLSAKSNTARRYFLEQCEAALSELRTRLGEAAWHWKYGKHAVLLFTDTDVYYRYISHFFEDDGEYGTSLGTFLRRGYCHTALAPQDHLLPSLIHEMLHLCLARCSAPLWLEEGLAGHWEGELSGQRAHRINQASIAEQRDYWNAQNIQRFWSGRAFQVGDERQKSYVLAEYLVAALTREFRHLGPFIQAAHWKDAGQAAARQHLNLDLSDLAAAFLGPGHWQPHFAQTVADKADGKPSET